MKFEINKIELFEKLQNIVRNSSPSNEVYKFIQIEAVDSNFIKILSSNGTVTMEYIIEARNVSGNAVLINGKKFAEIINKLDGNISFDDGQIKSGRSKLKIGVRSEAFLKICETAEEPVEINAEEFEKVVKNRLFACETNIPNSILSSICLNKDEIVSCNGNMLSLGKFKNGLPENVLIPQALASEVIKCFKGDFALAYGRKILFFNDELKIESSQLEGKYPPYKQLIPNYHQYIEVDKEELIKALDLLITVLDLRSKLCVFELNKNQLTISTTSEETEGQSVIDIEYNEEPVKIGFNAQYVLNALKNTNAEKIKIFFAQPTNAVIFEGEDEKTLIMPIALKV